MKPRLLYPGMNTQSHCNTDGTGDTDFPTNADTRGNAASADSVRLLNQLGSIATKGQNAVFFFIVFSMHQRQDHNMSDDCINPAPGYLQLCIHVPTDCPSTEKTAKSR
jgi:hypothetical protein